MLRSINNDKIDAVSKILKVIGVGEAELMRDRLELFGPIRFLENHYYEKEDIIVKYKRLEDSMKAYEVLSVEFEVVYVPTKHNSDEANNFNINDQD